VEGNLLYQYAYRSENLLHADLPSFWVAAKLAFAEAHSPYDYDAMLAHGGEVGRHVFPFLYPPPSLLALYPLKLVTWPAAAVLVAAANHLLALACIALLLALLRREGDAPALTVLAMFLGASLLTGLPVVNTLVHGQSNLLVLFLLCSTWLALRYDRQRVAGAALALAILIKPSPAIFLLYLAARRSWRALGASVLALVAAAAATLALLPSGLWRTWLLEIRPSLGYGRQPLHLFSPACASNQSLNALVSRFFLEPACLPIDAPLPIAGRALAYALAIAVLVLSLNAVRRTHRGAALTSIEAADLGFCLFLATMFLTGSLSWEHHLVFAMPGWRSSCFRPYASPAAPASWRASLLVCRASW
jgi:alpha-1,2-mannosyltransferase